MKIVLQRVSKASVSVEGKTIGAIDDGFLILLGVSDTDTEEIADKMVDKLCKLRIFQDENGKTNRSLADVGGQLLVVSQFTLYADCSEGNRPSFSGQGPRIWQTGCMNTWWSGAGCMWIRWSMESSEPICRWNF